MYYLYYILCITLLGELSLPQYFQRKKTVKLGSETKWRIFQRILLVSPAIVDSRRRGRYCEKRRELTSRRVRLWRCVDLSMCLALEGRAKLQRLDNGFVLPSSPTCDQSGHLPVPEARRIISCHQQAVLTSATTKPNHKKGILLHFIERFRSSSSFSSPTMFWKAFLNAFLELLLQGQSYETRSAIWTARTMCLWPVRRLLLWLV